MIDFIFDFNWVNDIVLIYFLSL